MVKISEVRELWLIETTVQVVIFSLCHVDSAEATGAFCVFVFLRLAVSRPCLRGDGQLFRAAVWGLLGPCSRPGVQGEALTS